MQPLAGWEQRARGLLQGQPWPHAPSCAQVPAPAVGSTRAPAGCWHPQPRPGRRLLPHCPSAGLGTGQAPGSTARPRAGLRRRHLQPAARHSSGRLRPGPSPSRRSRSREEQGGSCLLCSRCPGRGAAPPRSTGHLDFRQSVRGRWLAAASSSSLGLCPGLSARSSPGVTPALLCYPAGWQAHGQARVPQLTAPAAAISQKLLAGGGHSTVLSRSGHPGDSAACALVLAPACRPRGALRQVGKAKGPCQWLAPLHRAAARLLPGALFSPM